MCPLSSLPGASPLLTFLDALDDLTTALQRVEAAQSDLPPVYRPTLTAAYPPELPAFPVLAAALIRWAEQFTHPHGLADSGYAVDPDALHVPAFLRRPS